MRWRVQDVISIMKYMQQLMKQIYRKLCEMSI